MGETKVRLTAGLPASVVTGVRDAQRISRGLPSVGSTDFRPSKQHDLVLNPPLSMYTRNVGLNHLECLRSYCRVG